MPTADELVAQMRTYLPSAEGELLKKAWLYGAAHHHGQRRKSGAPYYMHPVAVAQLIMRMRLDEASICAGLLHDVVEDTPVTTADITALFSEDIAHIVEGVTKLDKIPFSRTEHKQAENFRKMLIAMSKDIRVLLIKLCDRLHNMSTLEAMRPDKQQRIALETLEIYAPLANRLGMGWMKSQLEDLCFRYLYPDDYTSLKADVGQRRTEREAYVKRVVALIRTSLSAAGLDDVALSGRPKHLYGIYRKMKRQNLPYAQIYDAQGFRVLTDSVEQCYRALGVVHSKFTPIPGRFKDYIALSKANNYQSLHTTVMGPAGQQIEIQIRTKEMHRIAENGVAAHWRYKEAGKAISPKDEERFTWLKQLLEWNAGVSDNDEFLDNMKVDLFNDEVYTFTPAGELKVFPRGATPVDFAYAVHTRVGETALGAKVNGRITTLNTELRNGDVVEIMTRADSRPSRGWLDFVKTARAKTKIRNYIRQEQRSRALDIGRDLLEKAFRRGGYSLTRAEKHENFAKMLSRFRTQTFEELQIQVGYGKIAADEVVRWLLPTEEEGEPQPPPPPSPRRAKKMRGSGPATVVVAGINDVVVRLGRCCTPVPGDDIIGFVTRGRGITVHQYRCPRARDADPLRRIDVGWSDGAEDEVAPVTVRVHTGNSPGMLAEMTQRFRESGVNILQANCRAVNSRRAVNEFEVEVKNADQLASVIRGLKKLQFVHKVERVRA
ncbi:MAG: bifunctional (p)ppGpp synthetase/guanosine-3',5'-bis(diphosphate) 3'-pyrophosphohydrolase [Myxococcales bacterium]|nr:bifunctional (p)ppGpp synthetase/guanosine-3',5'-bis(diphosphate) 3'-pyrophosphohydrolase [Myxococcales bacterium]